MKIYKTTGSLFLALTLINLLFGCTGPGPQKMTTMSSGINAKKEMQTSRFKDVSEQDLLNKVVTLIQDTGFQIIYANTDLGIIIGEKPGDFGLHFKENMGGAFSFGLASKQPVLPYRLGIIATTQPGINEYLLRVKVMRIWRSGAHQNIIFANDFENASLYQKIFTRLLKLN